MQMLKKIIVSIAVACSAGLLANIDNGFVLITVLYNETNAERIAEYIECFERNRMHTSIDSIHVIYDTVKDEGNNVILDHLIQSGVAISYVQGRVPYAYCFDLANRLYPNRRIILSNADIYFNDTLTLLDRYDFTDLFFALTRWDVRQDGSLEIFKQYNKEGKFWPDASIRSQDVWMFQTPLRAFNRSDIFMGTMQCDSRIAFQAASSGLAVINPCLTIQCCHLHLSDVRNYDKSDRYTEHHLMQGVAWSQLPD
ncbi:MAG TPA: hypothetical protein VGT41_00545 [Candidatus Babeliales bacterium]|nr:hypothetical protein [Candidatus Babeliales bacterium]